MTKTELTQALDAAHRVLGYKIALAHEDICNARRAIRRHPECSLFPRDLWAATQAHERAKRLSWLAPEHAAAVRAHAAQFVRDYLLTSRRLIPRAFPAASPVSALPYPVSQALAA
jgi:hypothetical protein